MNAERIRKRVTWIMALAATVGAPAAAQTTLTWTNNVAGNRDWSTSVANWTADGGATFVAWAQGANAVFDSVLTDSTIRPRLIGGALKVSHLTANYSVTLDKASGNDADQVELVGDARVTVAPGATVSFRLVSGSAGLTLDGGGTVSAQSGFSYTGSTRIHGGMLLGRPPASSTVYLLDTSGSANATWHWGGNQTGTNANPVVVQAGGSGTARVLDSSASGTREHGYAGAFTLNRSLTFERTGSQGITRTLIGPISGPGDIIITQSHAHDRVMIAGDNRAHGGAIIATGRIVTIDGITGNSRITATNATVNGTGTLTCNVIGDTADGITLGTGANLVLTDLSLTVAKSGSRTQRDFVLIDRKDRVTGTFATVTGGEVLYAGTDAFPDAVVLRVPLNRATLILVR